MVIIVEGKDDNSFIVALLNDLRKNGEIVVQDNINFDNYIEVMGGKSKLLDSKHTKYKKIQLKIDNDDIQKVLFIFDCDFEEDDNICGGMEKSLECFDNLKDKLKWNIDIDFYIFDKNLDYFLMETIKDKDCYQDFKGLVNCLDIEKLKPNKKPIANLYRDLYPYPKFDFKDDNFKDIKRKLKNLFKEDNGK